MPAIGALAQNGARDSVDEPASNGHHHDGHHGMDGEGDDTTMTSQLAAEKEMESASPSPIPCHSGSGDLAEEEKEDSFIVGRTTNSSTNSRETTVRKAREQSLYLSSSRKSITRCSDACDSEENEDTLDSDDYLDDAEINAMIRSFRRISKSNGRPRAYSKTRRISQVLFLSFYF